MSNFNAKSALPFSRFFKSLSKALRSVFDFTHQFSIRHNSLSGNKEKKFWSLTSSRNSSNNLYGLAQCGRDGSVLDGNPIDRIPIASRLIKFPVEDAFLVEAKGDSMEPKIRSGDLVIAQKRNIADNGSLVICVNNEEVLIKKYYTDGKQTILRSENSKYDPFIASNDFKIEGIVKGIINYS